MENQYVFKTLKLSHQRQINDINQRIIINVQTKIKTFPLLLTLVIILDYLHFMIVIVV